MAIVTSCRRENFLQMHRESGLLGYFDFILTREDYGASKPDPEPYRTACARAGLHPGRCLAIEDSERGVTAAARAGLAVAAIPGAMNQGGDFSAARWLLDGIHQLPALLGLKGIVVTSNGWADRLAFATALKRAAGEARHDLIQRIGEQVARIHTAVPAAPATP